MVAVAVEVRIATPADEDVLRALDLATWSTLVSPAPRPPDDRPFFGESTRPEEVLVAVVDGKVVGYSKLQRPTPLPASDHVRTINGFVVAPGRRRQGIGTSLLRATADAARADGARRLTLRVLGHNVGARRLYESHGFVVEGVLRGEFLLDGEYADDVLMARDLS
jgi:ribosomal protein S18 acetylase RimI-like enzyme